MFAGVLGGLAGCGRRGEWLTDLAKAQAKAKQENKAVLMDFTGSDWCPPCKALHKNVLSTEAFAEYAKKNLVLMEVDFPKGKAQPEELKQANKKLAQKYGIEGYPTMILLSSEGKELKRSVGYSGKRPRSTSKNWIKPGPKASLPARFYS